MAQNTEASVGSGSEVFRAEKYAHAVRASQNHVSVD